MAQIKNIIFDLGGVLLDIDTGKTNEALVMVVEPEMAEALEMVSMEQP